MKLSFLDPQNDPKLLLYARHKTYANEVMPYNFYSLAEYGVRLDDLFPKPLILELLKEELDGDGNTLAFDQQYCKQILNDEPTFKAFMHMMCGILTVPEINVLSNYTNPLIMPILDSLIKFIQERYGIDSFIINEYDDIDELATSSFASLEQQAIFTKDCERYAKLSGKPIVMASQQEIDEDKEARRSYTMDMIMDINLANYDAKRFGII